MRTLIKTFIATILLTFFVTSCVQERVQPISEIMKKELQLLPVDASVYGYFNLQRFQDAKFAKTFSDSAEKMLENNKDLQEFIKETGLNPREDINEVYMTLIERGEMKPKGLVVLKGSFDQEKILDFIRRNDDDEQLAKESFEDFTIFSVDKKQMAFSFVDEKTVVAGAKISVEEWLMAKKDGKQKVDKNLLATLKDLKYKNGMWMAINPQAVKEHLKDHQLKKLEVVKDVEQIGFSMDIADDLKLAALGKFADAEKAQLLQEAIKGFIATGKLSVSSDRQLIDLLNSIKVEANSGYINVDFKITEKDARELLEKKKELQKKMLKSV